MNISVDLAFLGVGNDGHLASIFSKKNNKKYPENNLSWEDEWKEFIDSIEKDRAPLGSGEDGLEVMNLAWSIYKSAETGKFTAVSR